MSINITDELHAATTKGKIASAKEVFLTGDIENLQQIGEKTHQLEDSIKNIAATGGASTAAAVTFDNAASGMTAVNAQGAIEELNTKNKTQDTEIAKKANSVDVNSKINEESTRVDAEIAKKVDKTSIVQEFGESEDKVVSQFALPFREIESPEFINCIVDSDSHLLFGIQLDGSIEWSKGIPIPIKDKLQEIANQYQQDKIDLTEIINTAKEELSVNISALQKGKVDKEEGKSLIKNEIKECFNVIENEEFINAITDSEDRLLFGIYKDSGKPYFPFNETYHVEQNEEYFAAWLDADNHILLGIKRDGQIIGEIHAVNTLKEVVTLLQSNISSLQDITDTIDANLKELLDIFSLQESPECMAVETDADGKVISATYNDGSHYMYNLRSETIDAKMDKEKGKSLIEDNVMNILNREDVFSRNKDKIPALQSACRYNNGKQDFQMCIIADSHGENNAVKNAVILTNKINVLDAIIHCGDITGENFNKPQISAFFSTYSACTKPWLVVVGNHDVGNTMYIQYSATHEEVYQYFIKPMVDNKILKNGEYTENVPYYYHDFPERKIRIIVVYEYDNPLDIADNEYWELIDYDSSIPQIVPGNSYHIGDKINTGGYTEHSFMCKKEVNTVAGQYDRTYTMPYYKAGRCARVIRKEQALWIVESLRSTPNGYGVIIATHNPSMINSTNQRTCKFAVDAEKKAITQGQYAMSTDLLSEIVQAFTNKESKSLNVAMKSANWQSADASYLNVYGSGENKYAYTLDINFTDIGDITFMGYVGGHSHKDLVFKHDTYNNQYGINPVCAVTNSPNRSNADIVNTGVDSICYDALTCISVSKGRIALSRLGNRYSISGKFRDLEIINY